MNRATLQRTVFLIVIVGAGGIVALTHRQHQSALPDGGKQPPFPSDDTLHSPLVPPGPQVSLLFRWQDANGDVLEESQGQLLSDRGDSIDLRQMLPNGSTAFSCKIHLTPHIYPDNTVRFQMNGDAQFPDGSKATIKLDKTVADGKPVTAATVTERTDPSTGKIIHAPAGRPFHTLTLTPKIDHSDDPSPRSQPQSAHL